MRGLIIQCRYIAHSYSGVRRDYDQRDELDWPPAPARLHQALVAATLVNLPESLRHAYSCETLDALRWLETLPPPDIIASRLAADEDYRRALLVAMPHNSPAKGDFARHHPDLAPVFHATPEPDGNLLVAYRWTDDKAEFCQKVELHFAALKEAAAKLRYLGRAEDRTECEVIWREGNSETTNESLEIWRPVQNVGAVSLQTARPNSTNELMQEFAEANQRILRGSKRPARLFLRDQGYSRDAAEGLRPVHVAIFQIFRDTNNPNEPPVVCDAANAHRWRSPLRELACKIAKESHRWNDPALAQELISGHAPGGERTRQPHLAFVPLPSISLHGKADGRVRRFALLGYAEADKASGAASIYRTLAASLDCEEIEPGYHLQLIEDLSHRDKVWRLYAGSSQVWLSVTPVVIDRGYKVPVYSPNGQPLSSNERHLRRQSEWTSLVRASLRHIGLPDDIVAACKILLTPGPLFAATERAERYRPQSEMAPFFHVRLDFPGLVRGPLLVGDRGYLGFGLFVPAIG
ncbi:MAG TPA: type I-U CRISPR-associated protein Csb2 [Bryobacteraceae bacterium]|jgi:CRISPR-associated protein Csb2|nr:type I-U CRISPR-associated protein Csb2 [Bryobacteraceae bacterium]